MNKNLRLLIPLLLGVLLISCEDDKNTLYESDQFSVFKDHVEQGEYKANVVSSKEMNSTYKSPLQDAYSRAIEFKFSINGKDDELPYGKNHRLVVRPENGKYTSPVIKFGEQKADTEQLDKMDWMEKNTSVTIRVDFSKVLKDFENKGYYEDIHGEKIYKKDFKGLYVAGGSAPMKWDFDNLGDFEQLKDENGDGVYEITLTMNQPDPEKITSPVWKSSKDLSKYPTYNSDIPLVDALYNLALNELVADSEADGTFRTGKEWGGVWTRDISYSIVLSLSILDPERAKTSLRRKVKRNRIIQDTGSGGAWPVSSDRVTWALAAWNVYTTTGDKKWLKEAYEVISNTIEDDMMVVYDEETGLMRGESSFLDWRKQTYPRWMDNVDIYRSLNLGTNVDHYEAMQIAARMAGLLGKEKDAKAFKEKAVNLKNAINNHLWMEDKGYYAQYLYGRDYMVQSPKFEALGEALSIIFDVASEEKAKTIVEKSPITPFGAACVYPQIPGIRPYHNNGIWPFVQAYWNIATAKAGNGMALEHGLASIYRPAALFLTNKENFVAEDGDYMDTEVNSDEMLWSLSGNMAMIYRVYFGINIDEKGILHFNPVVPKRYGGKKELKNVKLWENNLDITLSGYGNQVKSITIDGKSVNKPQFDLSKGGKHTIEIVLSDNDITEGSSSNKVPNKFHLGTPVAKLEGGEFVWEEVKGANEYEVFINGKSTAKTNKTSFTLSEDAKLTEIAVRAIDTDGDVSYLSEPIQVGKIMTKNISRIARASKRVKIADAPSGVLELSKSNNKKVSFKMTVPESGDYMVWLSYTNGSGPWNTDNKCAIRTLYVNNTNYGALVMAQRGTGEWSSIGKTNHISVKLKKGVNNFSLRFEDYNENMNVDVNTALIENVYLIKK
ncbi:family 78 glycoside hydrolase catalytic domain [Flammeovirga sp. MY04]|uniref:alpha-L-rhamnosidase-related protein n=1 Tax=Flammeovirga sp. MY04 TaxID=1191459 RepID=UPI00080622FD|nr:trehalase family glycosidase [Flammeovirga sp. MY04]ANQ48893.1 family 78 glycoside hydrolase catalytic domain [Flammeovirga sp. MY04]